MKPKRGTGSLYRQPGSRFWWVCYYRNGKQFRESTKTEDNRQAERYLAQKVGQINTGAFVEPKWERVRYEELAQDLLTYYVANGNKSLVRPKSGEPYVPGEPALRRFFTGYRVLDITSDRIGEFKAKRRAEEKSNATINRSLAALKCMFNLAKKAGKVRDLPYIQMLEERNVRKGFIGDHEYASLCREAKELWLRSLLAVGYTYGWRKGELLSMRVRQVNLLERTLTLDPGSTKNNEGRTVGLTQEVFDLLRECVRGKRPEDYVFSRNGGKPIRDFAKAWRNLCKSAEVPGLLFHDLRRSAVRNLERAGIARSVAMGITGHKTETVYRRYAIVSQADIAEATKKLEQRNVHTSFIESQKEGASEDAKPAVQ